MLLSTLNLTKNYKKNKVNNVINRLSLDINYNEILGIVGESGCGKSTLSRLLINLEKPTLGHVIYKGQDLQKINKVQLKEFRRSCQIIFQDNLSSLNPNLTVRKILKEPLDNNYKINEYEKNIKIVKMLTTVNLSEDIIDRYPNNLSGGERQRINICRALLMEPKLLICDEITSSLDVIAQLSLLKLLKELKEKLGMSIIFISHNIDAVRYIADRIAVLKKGELIETLDKSKKFAPVHVYTNKLFSSTPINHPSKR